MRKKITDYQELNKDFKTLLDENTSPTIIEALLNKYNDQEFFVERRNVAGDNLDGPFSMQRAVSWAQNKTKMLIGKVTGIITADECIKPTPLTKLQLVNGQFGIRI